MGRNKETRRQPGGRKPQPAVAAPPAEKRPFKSAPTVERSREQIAWRVSMLDDGGPWSCLTAGAHVDELLGYMRSMESRTWGEIVGDRNMNKPIPVDAICPDAQRRLQEIERDDLDDVWELRVSGKKRIWGVRHDHVFYVLWWDPEHTVCPSNLRNT